VTRVWWWIGEDKHPWLYRDSNPRSQRSNNQNLRMRDLWDRRNFGVEGKLYSNCIVYNSENMNKEVGLMSDIQWIYLQQTTEDFQRKLITI
jgi:hypothetical protein